MLAEKPDQRQLSGLETMRALLEGRVAPPAMATTLGLTLEWVEEGLVVFEAQVSADLFNPHGPAPGGWLLTLIDSCTGCAAHTTLPAGVGYTSVATDASFVAAITPETGLVRAEGRVVSANATIITAEGKVTDSAGRVLAYGSSTLIVLRR
jgi:uncharacterized protein (TIGR00369 family)